jgi:uncharacterized protein (DUF2147 family)
LYLVPRRNIITKFNLTCPHLCFTKVSNPEHNFYLMLASKVIYTMTALAACTDKTYAVAHMTDPCKKYWKPGHQLHIVYRLCIKSFCMLHVYILSTTELLTTLQNKTISYNFIISLPFWVCYHYFQY